MRRLVLVGAVAALASVSSASRADEPATSGASAPPFAYGALPQGHIADMPAAAKRPAAIPAGSKVPGLFVVRPPRASRTLQMAQVFLVGTADEAKDVAAGAFTQKMIDGAACVTTSGVASNVDGEAEPWQGVAQTRAQVMWRATMPGLTPAQTKQFLEFNPRVQATHVERMSRGADGKSATLDWVDAWVDPVTAGARTISQGSLALSRVATGPAGVEVYAGRDQGFVHLVVRTADPGAAPSRIDDLFARQIQAVLPNGTAHSMTDCGFLRVTLRAGAKVDQMATFESEVLLPPLHPSPAAADGAATPLDVADQTAAAGPSRRRPLLVDVSSTQTAADAEPLVSVSFGWDGKDDGS